MTHTMSDIPIDSDGIVQIAAFALPPSLYISKQAQRAFATQSFNPPALRETMLSMAA